MAMKRCEADLHFYDMDKHKSCPYCERMKEDERPAHGTSGTGGTADACSAPTILMNSETQKPITVQGPMDDSPTAVGVVSEESRRGPLPEESAPTVFEPVSRPGNVQRSTDSVPVPPPVSEEAKVESVSAPEGMTVMVLQEKATFNPTVGWLVCTEGPERGKDYHIKSGINEIGREDDPEVDIVIKGDSLISRRYHAEIQYDPEDNVYYVIQKKNKAVKVNDVEVRRPTKLTPYDMLQLGGTKLLFVPLCSDRFKWPDCK